MPSRVQPAKTNKKIQRSAGKTSEFPCCVFAVTELTKNMGVVHGNVECFRSGRVFGLGAKILFIVCFVLVAVG
jgi:hypothetical protein